jgi:hypothetical protein
MPEKSRQGTWRKVVAASRKLKGQKPPSWCRCGRLKRRHEKKCSRCLFGPGGRPPAFSAVCACGGSKSDKHPGMCAGCAGNVRRQRPDWFEDAVELVMAGQSTKEVGEVLGVLPATISYHLSRRVPGLRVMLGVKVLVSSL